MAEFVFIQNSSTHGKIAISQRIFDQIVTNALSNVKDVSISGKQLKKNQKIRLNRPVQTSIKRGIVHVWVSIDVKKGSNLQLITSKINSEISTALAVATEQIPFDVQVKVESFI